MAPFERVSITTLWSLDYNISCFHFSQFSSMPYSLDNFFFFFGTDVRSSLNFGGKWHDLNISPWKSSQKHIVLLAVVSKFAGSLLSFSPAPVILIFHFAYFFKFRFSFAISICCSLLPNIIFIPEIIF